MKERIPHPAFGRHIEIEVAECMRQHVHPAHLAQNVGALLPVVLAQVAVPAAEAPALLLHRLEFVEGDGGLAPTSRAGLRRGRIEAEETLAPLVHHLQLLILLGVFEAGHVEELLTVSREGWWAGVAHLNYRVKYNYFCLFHFSFCAKLLACKRGTTYSLILYI